MNSTREPSLWLETKIGIDTGSNGGSNGGSSGGSNAGLTTDLEADVAIIGAGITGLTAAYQLAKDGLKVIVLERQSLGVGESFHTTAHLSARPDVPASELIERFGEADARRVWASGAEAIRQIEDVCALEKIDAHFERVDGWLIARNEEGRQTVNDELAALDLLGVAHELSHSPIHAQRAIRIPDQARFDVGRYLSGLAAAAVQYGAKIVEHSAVVSMTGGKVHELTVADPAGPGSDARVLGIVRAKRVIVATHVPIWTHYLVLDKLVPWQSYVIAAKVPSGAAPDALIDDTNDPYHYYRLEPREGHDLVIFGGEDHRTGSAEASLERFEALESELRSWLPEVAFEVTYRWSGEVWASLDGLPYIGPDLAPAPERFIATGFDGVGMTFGTLAGMMAADWAMDKTNEYADLYAPGRLAARDIKEMVSQGIGFAKQFVTDRLPTANRSALVGLDSIQPGHGAIMEVPDLGRVAAYRNSDSSLMTVSPVCTHAGCIVDWNDADHTWDCGCHGARFAPDGTVLAGPAVHPLKPIDHE
jgi:glycine/D-amino acid oxidase-like deaminating enzyme/nitrite reductase/ring-hydroxylating ferredoxin subunit